MASSELKLIGRPKLIIIHQSQYITIRNIIIHASYSFLKLIRIVVPMQPLDGVIIKH